MSVVLSEHLPLLASAPDGIQKLRGLILELAVRGKLVPQDPNDEPASELLKRIAEERGRLEAEEKIKKSKPTPPIGEKEKSFYLPNSWEWIRFGNATICRDGERIPVSKDERNQRERIYDYYGASGVIDKTDGYLFDKPLLLIGEDGANLINRSTPIAFIAHGKYWVNNHAHVIDGISESYLRYLELFINAIDLKPYVTGTAQPKMNQAKMNSIPIALPPEPEQHRILAKVDELLALCDRLEAEQTDAESAHAKLVETLLGTLTQSTDASELAANWLRLAEHFDTLFTTESSLDALKQTILQLAVMGRLVPQDPNDEPASELLKRIAKERARLEAEGICKKSKTAPLVSKAAQPNGWMSAILPELCEIGGGATPSKAKSEYWDEGLPWVSPKDMKVDQIFDAQDHVTELALCETRLPRIPAGSLLVVVRGMILAHSFPVATTQVDVAINQDMKSLTPFIPELQSFLALALRGWKPQILALVDRSTHGTCKLQSEKLFAFEFGIPPLAEQHRIVTKVDELMALCDRLKADLVESRSRQARLSATLIESALQAA